MNNVQKLVNTKVRHFISKEWEVFIDKIEEKNGLLVVYLLARKNSDTSLIKTIVCRAKGHSCGVVWFNPSGLEPDMHCRNCNDDLG